MSDDGVAGVVQAYALHDVRVLEQPSERVLHVVSRAGELAIKRFAPAQLACARREAALLAHLADADDRYRVQTLVPTRTGEPMHTGEHEAVLVTRWAAGHTKVYTAIDEDEWSALGRSLGALHQRLERVREPFPRWSERFAAREHARERDAIEALRPLCAAKDPSRAQRLGQYFDDQRALFDACFAGASRAPRVVEQPIHNDYNQHNYLFDGRLPPIILDWDRAIAAPREYEVARCLNHLPIVNAPSATAFIDGYRAVLPLRPAVLDWAVDAALLEHALKRWPVERWLQGLPGSDGMLDAVVAMVRILAGELPRLRAFYASVSDA